MSNVQWGLAGNLGVRKSSQKVSVSSSNSIWLSATTLVPTSVHWISAILLGLENEAAKSC